MSTNIRSDDNLSHHQIPYVTQSIVRRLVRLLHMEYKPSEISEELGIPVKMIYQSFIPAGLPHRREGDRIWIVGTELRKWAIETIHERRRLRDKNKQKCGPNQGYCLRCRCVRDYARIDKTIDTSPKSIQIFGPCSVCGMTMCNFRKKGTQ